MSYITEKPYSRVYNHSGSRCILLIWGIRQTMDHHQEFIRHSSCREDHLPLISSSFQMLCWLPSKTESARIALRPSYGHHKLRPDAGYVACRMCPCLELIGSICQWFETELILRPEIIFPQPGVRGGIKSLYYCP